MGSHRLNNDGSIALLPYILTRVRVEVFAIAVHSGFGVEERGRFK